MHNKLLTARGFCAFKQFRLCGVFWYGRRCAGGLVVSSHEKQTATLNFGLKNKTPGSGRSDSCSESVIPEALILELRRGCPITGRVILLLRCVSWTASHRIVRPSSVCLPCGFSSFVSHDLLGPLPFGRRILRFHRNHRICYITWVLHHLIVPLLVTHDQGENCQRN
jgi:hypothetical protein